MKEAILSARAKSKESLEVAKELLAKGHYDFAASRAYYAMFYLAECALFTKGFTFSSHKGVISGFGKELVKTGIFPLEYHTSITKAFSLRMNGDYGDFQSVSKEQGEEIIKAAEDFCTLLDKYLESYLQDKIC
ncbi:MAG: HEPN domain-containing protein [Planctomycetota bacterium]|nr:HEPN domain-containing protein [Planctomycetota bacterium]MDI6787757.1 HEPN domain-containing protein [Planctomycetota bacterium]